MTRMIVIILVLAALLFPLTAAAGGNVPKAAECIGEQLDDQLMKRYTGEEATFFESSAQNEARSRIMIMGTTPANINNLNQANALARQMMEEIARWLMKRGYRYDEIRKGNAIRFEPRVGEFILTREVSQLASRTGVGQAILAGTYVISGEDVRFNISLINVGNGETLAKASATVPITNDLRPMLMENYGPGSGTKPSVYTRLR